MPLASDLIYTMQSPSIKLLSHEHESLPSTLYFCDLPCILTLWVRPGSDHLTQGPVDQYVELPNPTWDWTKTLEMFIRQFDLLLDRIDFGITFWIVNFSPLS